MKKIILNCSWNPGSYNFMCEFDENKAHYEVSSYKPSNKENRSGDLTDDELNKFLEMVNEIDFDSINLESHFPEEGYMMDIPTYEFLYVDGYRFYICRWQIRCETEEIEQIEDLIAYCDPKFNDLFSIK